MHSHMPLPDRQIFPSLCYPQGDRPARQDLVLAPDADGRQRHVRRLDEELVLRSALLKGPQPGKDMRVVEGRHSGLQCRVLALLPTQEGRSGEFLEGTRMASGPGQEVQYLDTLIMQSMDVCCCSSGILIRRTFASSSVYGYSETPEANVGIASVSRQVGTGSC